MAEAMKFEDALKELETLVGKMEAGNLPLENMISEFERGSKLVTLCRKRLDAMQRKIEILTRDDGGKGEFTDFEPDTPVRNAPIAPPAPQAPQPPQQEWQPRQDSDLPF